MPSIDCKFIIRQKVKVCAESDDCDPVIGVVTGVNWDDGRVTYRIEYMSRGDMKQWWFDEFLLEAV